MASRLSVGRKTRMRPTAAVRIARIIVSHQLSTPKVRASTAIRILKSPSVRMAMPSAMKRKFITLSGLTRMITPRAISRTPNSRSYWNASRNRSFEK